jgi:hypothetical protein
LGFSLRRNSGVNASHLISAPTSCVQRPGQGDISIRWGRKQRSSGVRPIAQNFIVLIEVGDANYDPVVTHSPIDLCHRADLLIRQTTDVIVRIAAYVFLGKTSSPNSASRAPMRQERSAFGPYTLRAPLSFQLHRRDLSLPPITQPIRTLDAIFCASSRPEIKM